MAVLDASALVALLWEEPGGESVEALLPGSAISTVNWAEVLQRYHAAGVPTEGKQESIEGLGVRIEPFTSEDAELAAALWPSTRSTGLSLGDRACLALASRLGVTAYTADQIWASLELGVAVELIR